MPTHEELKQLQSLTLDQKIDLTKERIYDWIDHYGENGVYISFSGGKDSTVLLDIARQVMSDIPAVFVDTGLEYPEVRRFARSIDNVTVIRPQMSFADVIRQFGYPFLTKEFAQAIYECRAGLRANNGTYQYQLDKFNDTGKYAPVNGKKNRFSASKYKPLLYVDFSISHKCCVHIKKRPSKQYEKESKRHPILGMMATESVLRKQQWLKHGCNAFDDSKRPTSCPMSFWTDQDVLEYIKGYKLEIAEVYGDIVYDGCKYKTSGCERTGCIMCGFGAHRDKGESRFERLKRTHPKQYDYCMRGGVTIQMTCFGSRTITGLE